MGDKKLKLCLVGCGTIGRVHADACLKRRDAIELHACDTNEQLAAAAMEEFGAESMFTTYEQVLADRSIEAVDICLPHHLHMQAAISAFEAGKHVLLEKPIANSLAEADSVIEAAQKAGRVLAVSENFRFEPGIRRAIEIIERGDIGNPFLIMIQELNFSVEVTSVLPACEWRRREATCGGGVLFDRGVHLMATVNQLGGPARSVYALTRSPAGKWESDETSVVTIVHESGVITSLIESWNVRSAPPAPMMAIYGTEGSIIDSPEKRLPGHGPFEIGGMLVYSSKRKEFQAPRDSDLLADAKLYLKMFMNAEAPDDVLERTLARGTPVDLVSEFGSYSVYEASIMDFVECVRTGKAPHVGGKEARADIELVFAAYESSRTGRPVTLPLS